MKITNKSDDVRLKYICPNCGTKRIKRHNKKQIDENTPERYSLNNKIYDFPLICIMGTCRKCHIKGCNIFEYLETLDIIFPIKINKCDWCGKETKKLFLLTQNKTELSIGNIICKECREKAINIGYYDRKIQIFSGVN